jgi:hypothetical protein
VSSIFGQVLENSHCQGSCSFQIPPSDYPSKVKCFEWFYKHTWDKMHLIAISDSLSAMVTGLSSALVSTSNGDLNRKISWELYVWHCGTVCLTWISVNVSYLKYLLVTTPAASASWWATAMYDSWKSWGRDADVITLVVMRFVAWWIFAGWQLKALHLELCIERLERSLRRSMFYKEGERLNIFTRGSFIHTSVLLLLPTSPV